MARAEAHWLWRLSAVEWLAAAQTELDQGHARLDSRRTTVTHARRAAGMALNAVLVAMSSRGWSRERCEGAWGRSYIDHVRALARAESEAERAPFDLRMSETCAALLAVQVMPGASTGLVSLSRGRHDSQREALELAVAIQRASAVMVSSGVE